MMHQFMLERTVDVTGVSGTGMVAEGVEFGDGRCVIRWFGEYSSIVVWNNIQDAIAVHGHDGRTTVVWK